jgi:hypothetical protein
MATWYYVDNVSFAPVPEPSAAVLLTVGLTALASRRRAVKSNVRA